MKILSPVDSPAEAREKLLAQGWAPGEVTGMLERAGSDACRPDELEPQYGLVDGKYHLSPAQAQAILELRLHRLTGLEHEKLLNEYQEKVAEIQDYLEILSDPERLKHVIREELEEIVQEYGDERLTEITASQHDLTVEDLQAGLGELPVGDRVQRPILAPPKWLGQRSTIVRSSAASFASSASTSACGTSAPGSSGPRSNSTATRSFR